MAIHLILFLVLLLADGWAAAQDTHATEVLGDEAQKLAQLLLSDCPAASDPDLLLLYKDYNRRYFGNTLPADTLVVTSALLEMDDEDTGFIAFTLPAELSFGCDKDVLLFNSEVHFYQGQREIYLLHEMVHLNLWRKYNYIGHGRRFQLAMRQLAKRGAFDGNW